MHIGQQIVALDHQRRVIAPVIGIADLHMELVKLVERFLARCRSHPSMCADIGVVSLEQVADEFFGFRLGLGREVLRHVEFAERFAQQVIQQMGRARCARKLLRVALECRAVKGKVCIVELLWQDRCERVQVMHRQIIAPDGNWRAREDLGKLRKS